MSNALVIGGALSGISTAKYLNRKGYTVYLTDAREIKEKKELEEIGIRVFDNGHPDLLKDLDYEMIIKNPGIKYNVPFVKHFVDKGMMMLNETEIAMADQPQVKLGAITGTNGKTTTTIMLGTLLHTLNPDNGYVGNMGIPLCDYFLDHDGEEVSLAIEIAALQLIGCPSFHPFVSVIMNLTPDHVDYFGSVDAYYRAKTLIYKNQDEKDYFIRNVDDENILKYCTDVKCNVIDFSLEKEDVPLHIHERKAYYNDVELFDLDRFKLPGMHNVENAMIAGCMAYLMGVKAEDIKEVLENFKGVEHRIEYVETVNGVRYYNDSKGTNVDSTIMALKSFDCPVHLLVGGYDKKTGFEGLRPFLKNVKTMYAYGNTRDQFVPLHDDVRLYDNMFEALQAAHDNALPSEVVLLSPACASWDQFPNYEVRGKQFKEMVRGFKKG
ncbi:MAG: UDP-N-acetylmuramoyl-L-alanine--D-glutamate ligase [Erysipelotrichaceae bacterium]|nr:UDP-N-acetylmuramoyl-L-alanine--D-glutamate ligase [Erysipelotrichaceae bacterium]MBQ1300256.1 UDP-N-acetylmuramoyl-L-alanine--D-glutamate ligase [Erysipelotrichaceae bacterium]MBQ1303435.1 UDP-N-acetylmuramoyl-L-alanine--D-glutamate ligase [Erysipelotrichaceae bacterium]MBQ2214394.1 UDP-N-acetylmuramoyl-L-alanine--D-glutamate ligase [Erysipelotrichaceae bacterium]MBR2792845.1 UDP-N-acetylmuramoyl-L-alanine--D-glutamate ligase [Erysipelotrichaceae bacterium]